MAPTPAPIGGIGPDPSFLFGTLITEHERVIGEYAAGVRVVHLEVFWDVYEPEDGVFNSAEIAWKRAELEAHLNAGMKVVLGIGLQYPPAWVHNYPNSHYVNQYGKASVAGVNLTFNPALRAKAERFMARVASDLGLHNFWAVRIGSGGFVETLYPSPQADGVNANGYWAYDANAQARTPYPGWIPGQVTYRGAPFSASQVREWYDWYLGSLVDGVDWQIATLKQLGFRGFLHVLMPGLGARPGGYEYAIQQHLASYDDGAAADGMPRGAVWHQVIDRIRDKANVVIYVSSMVDGSAADDLCQAGDSGVSLSDPRVNGWSATRWISYNANRHGLPKNGENPGRSDSSSYGAQMMRTAAAQMASCGFQGMMWAHDGNLYDGVSGVSLGDYAAVITDYQ